MTQPLYGGTGRGSGLNAQMNMGLGQHVSTVKKGDNISNKFPPNAGKTLVTNVPLSNRTITTTITTPVDASYQYPLISLIDTGMFDWDSGASKNLSTGGASSRNFKDLWDTNHQHHWSVNDNVGNTYKSASGIIDFFGVNKPTIAFSGLNAYYFMDLDQTLQNSAPFDQGQSPASVPYSTLTNWDIFMIVNIPSPSDPLRVAFGIEDPLVYLTDATYAGLGWSNNRPMIVSKIVGQSQNILFGGYTLAANTNYLLHYYSHNGAFGMRVNNLELAVTASGASINNGKFFQLPTLGTIGACPTEVLLGGIKGKALWDLNAFVGSFKLYPALTVANQSGVAYNLMNSYSITPLG